MKKCNGKMSMTFLAGTLFGTAMGVGLGVLFAPRKGKKTRKKIRKSLSNKAHDLSTSLKHSTNEFAKALKDKM